MDIYAIREQLKKKRLEDIPLKVTFYARVSTDSDEQLNSLSNQTSYYMDFINRNSEWEYVEGYIDEGLSGISTIHRENFNKMIDDAKQGKFDLIITKEISRFARNTVDSISYTRDLFESGVGVLFQNDGINTLDDDSELRLTIMAGMAQDELRKLSSRVKFGQAQAIKNGVVLGNSRIFGYTKDKGKLIIDEEEAQMVRELFELYATDEYSMKQIENIFWDRGYRNHNGNKISHTTMSNTISNPKYKGYYVGNKVKIENMFTKKQKFLPPEEWVMYKDETGEIVPAIVSEELWDRANAVLSRRSADVKERKNKSNHANLLTGKLYCTHCETSYYRKDSVYKGVHSSRWVCSGKLKNGKESCSSFRINEEEIKNILFKTFTESYSDIDEYIDKYFEYIKETLYSDVEVENEIHKTENNIAKEEGYKKKILQLCCDGYMSDVEFAKSNREANERIENANRRLEEIKSKGKKIKEIEKELKLMKSELKKAVVAIKKEADISISFVNRYIERIDVTPEVDGSMSLKIVLATGKTLDATLSRTGHTFKKMVEAYENGIK